MRKTLVQAVVTLALIAIVPPIALSTATAPTASASHYRANQVNWHLTGARTAEFHLTGSWRRSYCCGWNTLAVGQTFQPTSFEFGDGAWATPTFTVTAVDAANDVISGEAHFDHTYPATPDTFTASMDDCCRLSPPLHRNNPDGSVRLETTVALGGATTASPISTISPIVDCPRESTCAFTVPAFDPDQQPLRWRLATGAEAAGGTFTQPAGAAIDAATGLYSWNTTGASLNTGGDSFFSTQVMIENVVSSTVVTKTPVDFFIRVGNTTNQQPVFQAPTPADGSVLVTGVGGGVTFNTAASDPDAADVVTTGIFNAPTGSSFAATSGNPGTGVFTWTPTAAQAGEHVMILTAQDQHGLGATARALKIKVLTPTSLTVAPVVATLLPTVGTPSVTPTGNGISYNAGVSGVYVSLNARLRAGAAGTPLGGKPVRFTALDGTPICNATTFPDGWASCSNLVNHTLAAMLSTGYRAAFAGDAAYAPSTATGGLVSGP